MADLSVLSDDELEAGLISAAREEKGALRRLLEHLIEFDKRNLCRSRGYSHLFAYCTAKLGYSEDEACRRIQAARCARSNPLVLEKVGTGRLTLTSLNLIAPHLPEAGADLIEKVEGRSRLQVQELIAELAPQPERAEVVRMMPNSGVPASMEKLEPISGTRIRIALTLDRPVFELLQRAKDMLRHKFPRGRMEEIVGEALSRLMEKLDPTAKEVRARPSSRWSRRPPKWVRARVWKRDGGRCTFTAPDGRRCPATGMLQYDHVVPWSESGASNDPENIRLLCGAHNRHEYESRGVKTGARSPTGDADIANISSNDRLER